MLKPDIGQMIYVTTDWSGHVHTSIGNAKNGIYIKSGIVVALPKFRANKENEFALQTNNKWYPISIIDMRYVIKIEVISNSIR